MMHLEVVRWAEADGCLDEVLSRTSEPAIYRTRSWLRWDQFAELLDAVGQVRPDRVALVDVLAQGYIRQPGLAAFRRLVAMMARPLALYRLMDRIGPRTSPVVRSEFVELGARQLQITLFLARPDEPPCPMYWDITGRMLALLPQELMGLPPSRVQIDNQGDRAVYRIQLPRSRSLLSRLAAAWSAFWDTSALLEVVEQEQALTLEAQEALNTTLKGIEERISSRTTELQQVNAQLAAASQHKSRHLADMSHELRTPLNAIIGYAELLGEEARDEGLDLLVPDLERIEIAARFLLRLVNGVLDLSKIEAGRLEVASERVAMRELVEEVATALRPVVEGNNNRLVVEAAAVDALGDAHRTRQILTNLIGNAAKFTQDGEIRVELQARDERVVVEVTDTGVGMDAQTLETLFEPYRQASASTASQFGGTGLGLSIARSLAELMQGSLGARSTLGEGSTFVLSLPSHPG